MAITKPPPKAGAAAATSPATPLSSDTPAQLAKAALRRLALDKLEPTPDNYARAYQLERGGPPPAALPERAHRAIERVLARSFEGETASGILNALIEGDWDRAERVVNQPSTDGDALASLIERLLRGGEVLLDQIASDKYDRVLARVFVLGPDARPRNVAEVMVHGGHGRAYDGRKRAGWCG